ncbi:cellulose binding domain-containing protein [Planobispora siamensis]|uniref:CBM2 domain-containing protein n=1 Tax=Planobispora siamensis TaxID=936338 RepID=A0A8J3SYF7_9ACTN|nr:cellulose binding domain-containing protein [Planobispora siamensis]GIH97798.1 hypothetical protein Psi01_84280 [Planobispora siamensis]
MPQGRTTTLLGAASLVAAVALVAAACLGETPPTPHAAGHGPSSALLPEASPAAPSGTSPALPPETSPALPSGSSPAASPHSTIASAGCTATLTLVESWPGGYRGTATISNRTGTPMRDWYIQWLLPQGATITQAWKGTHMQSGPIAMIHAPAADPVLAPGATVSGIGFVGAATAPPAFTDITCG